MGVNYHTTVRVTKYTHTSYKRGDMPCQSPNLSLSFLLKSLQWLPRGLGMKPPRAHQAPILTRWSSFSVPRGLGLLLSLKPSAQAVSSALKAFPFSLPQNCQISTQIPLLLPPPPLPRRDCEVCVPLPELCLRQRA